MNSSTAERPLVRPPPPARRGRPPKYPWDEWVRARRPIQLYQAVDYSVDSKNFAIALRAAFLARGVKVRATVTPGGQSVFVETKR